MVSACSRRAASADNSAVSPGRMAALSISLISYLSTSSSRLRSRSEALRSAALAAAAAACATASATRSASATESAPANWSSNDRWWDDDPSRWCSCCPAISTSVTPTSAMSVTVASRPLMRALPARESAGIVRDMTSSTALSSAILSRIPCATRRSAAGWFAGIEKCPSTRASGAPVRTNDRSPLAPSSSERAATNSVFPAPVSPVRALQPRSRISSARLMTPSSSTTSSLSIWMILSGSAPQPPAIRRTLVATLSPDIGRRRPLSGKPQLRAEPLQESGAGQADHHQRAEVAPHDDLVSRNEPDPGGGVARVDGLIALLINLDLHDVVRSQNEGPGKDHMCADRHEDEDLRPGGDDRAPGTQGVGGRACRSCNDHAIRIESGKPLAADRNVQPHQALSGGALHKHLVEADALIRSVGLLAPEHHALFDVEVPRDDLVERRKQLSGVHLGEVPQAAEVHSEQRRVTSVRDLGGPEHCPVSPK